MTAAAYRILNDIIGKATMANRTGVDVLQVARPLALQFEPVSLSPVVDDAIVAALRHPSRVNTTIATDWLTVLPTMETNPLQLRQLLGNPLINTVEAFDELDLRLAMSDGRSPTTDRLFRPGSSRGCSARSARPRHADQDWD